jgi:hypothetical protein
MYHSGQALLATPMVRCRTVGTGPANRTRPMMTQGQGQGRIVESDAISLGETGRSSKSFYT